MAAAALFESLGVYEDAQTRGQLCRYTAGTNALSAGELEKAAEQLLAAGDYKDAPQKFADVATTLGNAALAAGDNQTAIGWLEQPRKRGDAGGDQPRGVRLCRAARFGRAEEAAAIEFYSLGGYEDAMVRGNALEYELAMSEKARISIRRWIVSKRWATTATRPRRPTNVGMKSQRRR